MNPTNIPQELRDRKQWVSFKIGPEVNGQGKLIKLPLVPGTRRQASCTNPDDWKTFQEALEGGHPAFVITPPYVFIDIDTEPGKALDDAMVEQFLGAFPTYTEVSTNGGIHLIGKGIPAHPSSCLREGVEIHSRNRFCIFTGELIEGRDAIQELDAREFSELEMWVRELSDSGPLIELDERVSKSSDADVLARCSLYSKKFDTLYQGLWRQAGEYPSQSEADWEFVAILTRHTDSNAQVRTLFRRSQLFRAKKDKNYVNRIIQKVRTEMVKEEENAKFVQSLMDKEFPVESFPVETEPEVFGPKIFDDMPEGLIKDCYEALQGWAHYPLKEASFLGAVALSIALFGRCYQTETEMGLNMWLFVLGATSSGKDTISAGPKALISAAKAPGMDSVLGGQLRSDSGIESALLREPSHIAHHGDCATWIADMCSEKSVGYKLNLRDKLMEVYSLSNYNSSLARVSNKDSKDHKKNELIIHRPCLSLTGDAVPEKFYAAISETEAASGFIPRMLIVESSKKSMALHSNRKKRAFDPRLLDRINELANKRIELEAWDPKPVPMAPEAAELYEKIELKLRRQHIESRDENTLVTDLRTRSAAKMLKLATLLAVGANPHEPKVTLQHMAWAVDFVTKADQRVCDRISEGVANESQHKQRDHILRLLDRGRCMGARDRADSGEWRTVPILNSPSAIPWAWLRKHAARLACFTRNPNRPLEHALDSILQSLYNEGVLLILDKDESKKRYEQYTRVVLIIKNPWEAKK